MLSRSVLVCLCLLVAPALVCEVQVGQDVLLTVPTKRGEPQRRVRVLVRTEGPTRVLTVLDAQRHSLPGERPGSAVAGGGDGIVASTRSKLSGWPPRGPWGAWSLPALGSTAVRDTRKEKHAELSGATPQPSRGLLSVEGQISGLPLVPAGLVPLCSIRHALVGPVLVGNACTGSPWRCSRLLTATPCPLLLQASCGRCVLTWHRWVSPWSHPPEKWLMLGPLACECSWRAQPLTKCWSWSCAACRYSIVQRSIARFAGWCLQGLADSSRWL